MNNKVSIIIPVYNAEKHISKCIESLTNQTYKEIQIILINDGSTDKSGQICEAYAEKDNRIIVIHKENGGVSSARNIGLENSTGYYIMFVDSDDWIEEDAIKRLMQVQNKYSYDLIMFGYYRENVINETIDLSGKGLP